MENFVVSARKYRPQTFDEVVGQRHVSDTLKKALSSGQVAHAFLFTGPRGVGKTTCARILAKVLNCQNLQDGNACNSCSSCSSFNNHASFNIFELDAASNNSVDHIRDLVSQVRIQPQQGDYRVFIIDEVHMLSQAAFNAFLKTLEEPPPHAIFILATTEKHKIIPTILSRCQVFDFKRIQVSDIVVQLKNIATQENITIEEDALHLIAEKADGGMRDALSLYDKIVSSYDKDIGSKEVVDSLNLLDYEYFFKFTDSFIKEDMHAAFLLLDEIIRNGFEAGQLLDGISQHIRNLMMLKDARTTQLLNCSPELKERYTHQANLCPSDFLLSALNILNTANYQLGTSNNKTLHAEMALAKVCYLKKIKTLAATQPQATEKKSPVLN